MLRGTPVPPRLPIRWMLMDTSSLVDSNNHRIIGQGPGGFRCVINCSGNSGLGPNQLLYAQINEFQSRSKHVSCWIRAIIVYSSSTCPTTLAVRGDSSLHLLLSYAVQQVLP